MPIYPPLPQNRLILNGNKLATIAACYAYIAKRLQVKTEITCSVGASRTLSRTPDCNMA